MLYQLGHTMAAFTLRRTGRLHQLHDLSEGCERSCGDDEEQHVYVLLYLLCTAVPPRDFQQGWLCEYLVLDTNFISPIVAINFSGSFKVRIAVVSDLQKQTSMCHHYQHSSHRQEAPAVDKGPSLPPLVCRLSRLLQNPIARLSLKGARSMQSFIK